MSSQNFTLPSSLENDSVTLLDIWEHHERHSSRHPLFHCTLRDVGDIGSVVTWGEATHAMHAAGSIILDVLVKSGAFYPDANKEERLVVGILAVSG